MPETPQIDPHSTAWFFDFDGVLVEIEERPEQVRLEPETRALLAQLAEIADGALAIVSGRAIADLDGFLSPFTPPLAGVHGLEYRAADGRVSRLAVDDALLTRLVAQTREFAATRPGTLVEVKPGALTLHYRQAPAIEEEAVAFARGLEAASPGVELVRGKMVAELRLGGRSKADAVSHFMAERPFAGRRPIFLGDDVTDEDGFRRVAELGGVSVKIGAGDTRATHRLPDVRALRHWLRDLVGGAGAMTGRRDAGAVRTPSPTAQGGTQWSAS